MTNLFDAFKPKPPGPLVVALADRELISLDAACGWRITCHRGRLWLSTKGKRGRPGQDIALERGDSCVIERGGKVVIEAFGYATLDLIAPLSTVAAARAWLIGQSVKLPDRKPAARNPATPPAGA